MSQSYHQYQQQDADETQDVNQNEHVESNQTVADDAGSTKTTYDVKQYASKVKNALVSKMSDVTGSFGVMDDETISGFVFNLQPVYVLASNLNPFAGRRKPDVEPTDGVAVTASSCVRESRNALSACNQAEVDKTGCDEAKSRFYHCVHHDDHDSDDVI